MPFDPTEDIKVSDLPLKTTAVANNDKVIMIDWSDWEVKLQNAIDIKWTDTYTKAQIDTKLAQKADSDQIITKTDWDWTKYLNDKWEYTKPPTWTSDWTVWETFTTNVTIWWLPAWTTINADDTITSVFKRMLVTYIAPSITCVITPATALYKKWTSVNITKFSATATKNSKPIQSIKFEMNSTELETITVWVENWWTFNYSWTVPAITTNTTFKTTVSDWTETKTSSKSIEFIVPFYWWASDNATVDSVTWFTEDLSKKSTKSYTYATNKQYVTIIYDNSYWALTSIKDQNWFEWISWFNTWTFEENWTTYKYYIAQLATTSASAKYTFTF